MADIRHSTSAPGANPPDTFDPATWLDRFRDVGGWWLIRADGKPSMGWMLEGFNERQNDDARALWREVERDHHRRAAIHGHLLANAGGVYHD